ncbi:DUF421 domain-containing protein [Mangrovibrevibacter kandeliae]|uniref:DUF421 domain-containing protein n=1 Tax=Mangrovibrevibacter kandeliae TaxID=2968473 RepID=UPI0021183AE9|nr:YetF domain-containing protein [Aurantimonas sp. CSK15Z-1]MCQ8783419.1 DUF421 domain-containing protein [Aurantimonas sp. CSK15Z-1]
MIYDGTLGLVRVLVVGVLAYLTLVAVLRVSGKRTLAKMNAFDFVVTVALGSTLATVLLSKSVALLEGALAFALLAALQALIAWLSQRSERVEQVVKSSPRLLLRDGSVDSHALAAERVTIEEVKAAVRKSGIGDLADVAAVVLETDGSFSVISRSAAGSRSAFPSS